MTLQNPAKSPVWKALQAHQKTLAKTHLRDLFAQDPERFERFSVEACGLLLDYSKHRIDAKTLELLLELAQHMELPAWRERLLRGEEVNNTEHRAALHTALRRRADTPLQLDGADVMPEVEAVLGRIEHFVNAVRSGEWRGYSGRPIAAVVNIGIGGSDLGPKMVVRALGAYNHSGIRAHFVSNLDATQLSEILAQLDPATTLFIVASKTFSTQETLTNARSARAWLVERLGEEAVSSHFVAVSTHAERVREFGIDLDHMFGFWDWVGGRYSLWSAIGLSVAVALGMDVFRRLLAGARAMDEHFAQTPLERNLPVIMGLLGVWYSDFLGASTHAVLPYDYALELLPPYLQQLEMESNGKRVRRDGGAVNYPTCPVLWGAPGNNGQHAFYQLLHQGTQLVPSDFIVAAEGQYRLGQHQDAVLANALAQTRALMLGRDVAETRAELQATGLSGAELEAELPHRVFPGNQPSSTLLYRTLTPEILGSLVALYEHKVFVQSVCWGVNPFDQWGVELGKQMAASLLPEFSASGEPSYDASTNGLLKRVRALRAGSA